MSWTKRTVVRDGVGLACRDRGGAGAALVLLHGLAGHAGEWERIAEKLSSRYRVADAVIDQLGLAPVSGWRPVLVGQPLGGHAALGQRWILCSPRA